MEDKILEEAGLTKNEIAVYKALLQLGATTAGPLTKKSGLHRSRVYEALDRLIDKGLVSYKIKANRKHFQAQNPEELIDFIEEKKQKLQSVIPELKAMQGFEAEKQEVNVYEGYKGVKSVYDNVIRTLKKGDEILVFGARGADESFMSKTFFKEYTNRRVAKGIKMKIIFNADAKETGKFYSKIPNTQVKYMPKNMKTPAAVDIFGNNVGTLILKPKPKVFLITSKEVANSYREFFEMLWEMAG
jgi:sugar-specific transcriptional regulator TrmB